MSEFTSLAIDRQTWLYAKVLAARSELSMSECVRRILALLVTTDLEQLNTLLFSGGQTDEIIRHLLPEIDEPQALDEQLNTNAELFGYLMALPDIRVE
jgi:hypothetical protein